MTDTDKKVMVSAEYVTKRFDLIERQSEKLKNFFKFWGDGVPSFWAVKGVSFEAHAGETIGIIGTNGSGKSTLLEMVAGIREPTTGRMNINGTTSIIAIGAGLRPQLTGRSNIRLKGLMQGMTEKELDEKMEDIIEFSELGDFIDQPVKSYSSGMKSKLGFAISAYSDSDIVIIDEALSVGDPTYTEKSIARTKRFKEEGKTIFFVSHSNGQMKQVADRLIWMHHGNVRMDGPTDVVMPEYQKFIKKFNSLSEAERYANQKRHKNAQKTFSLSKLRTLEGNRILLSEGHVRNKLNHLDETTRMTTGTDSSMPWATRILLAFLILGTGFLMTKQVLGITDQQFMQRIGLVPTETRVIKSELVQNTYTVKDGETLIDVSVNTGIPVAELQEENKLASIELVDGQTLTLPKG